MAANGRRPAVRELPGLGLLTHHRPSRMHCGDVGGRAELHQKNQASREPVSPSCAPSFGHVYIWALRAWLQPISQADPPTVFSQKAAHSEQMAEPKPRWRPPRGLARREHPSLYANVPLSPPTVGRRPLLLSASKASFPDYSPCPTGGTQDDLR